MSVIAYIRKSTDKQSFEHQEFEIEQYAKKNNLKIDRCVEESISSRKELKKRKLSELLCERVSSRRLAMPRRYRGFDPRVELQSVLSGGCERKIR